MKNTVLIISLVLMVNTSLVGQTTTTNETNYFKVTTPSGYVQIGPQNTSWSHFSTDRDKFYFNKPIYVNGSIHSYTGTNLSLGTYGQSQLTILESNGYVGIGTTNPIGKLHIKGDLYLDGSSTDASGAQETFLSYKGHHLIIGSQSGVYRHNILNIRPGGSSVGVLSSSFRMYMVPNENDNNDELKVLIHSNGKSYFNGGNVGIGTASPRTKLDVNGDIRFIGAANGSTSMGDGYTHFNHSNGNNYIRGNTYIQTTGTSEINAGKILLNGGNVGIGKLTPTAKLHVNGNIIAEEIKVENVTGADFVFAPNYNLMPLAEIEAFVKQNHHLPEVPSAAEMEANGIELGKMNMLLLQKIEELTLYLIELEKRNEIQDKLIEKLSK